MNYAVILLCMRCHTTVPTEKCSDAIHVGDVGVFDMVLCWKIQTNHCAHYLLYCFYFVIDASPKQAENQLKGKISHRCLLDWFTYCRDICTRHILNNFPQLGGIGTIVDETRIGHIRKAHRGYNRNQDGVDVFGMIDRSTSRGSEIAWQ